MIIINIFKVHPFSYLAVLICLLTGNFKGFVIFFCIIIIHELGHISMAYFLKWNISKVLLLPFGAVSIFEEKVNRPLCEEFLILIMGPIFQIIGTIILYFIFHDHNIILYSKFILFFNLLLILPLDGSKLINIILNKIFPYKLSHIITILISFISIVLIAFLSKFNFMILLSLLFLLLTTFKEYKNHRYLFNLFLLERRFNSFNFKKHRFTDGVYNMKKDYLHTFNIDGKYISEREMLKKMFDTHRKL